MKGTGWMMTDYQMDIFGNAVSVNEIRSKEHETIKTRFRRMYGFDEEHRCANCIHLIASKRDRTYYKCEVMGMSASEATDIRLKDIACKRWEKV